jgi:hypothetical protein
MLAKEFDLHLSNLQQVSEVLAPASRPFADSFMTEDPNDGTKASHDKLQYCQKVLSGDPKGYMSLNSFTRGSYL